MSGREEVWPLECIHGRLIRRSERCPDCRDFGASLARLEEMLMEDDGLLGIEISNGYPSYYGYACPDCGARPGNAYRRRVCVGRELDRYRGVLGGAS